MRSSHQPAGRPDRRGFAINFLALGLTGYLFRDIYGTQGTPSDIDRIPSVHLSFIEGIPFIGDVFGNLNLMIWLMFALLILSWIVIFRTPIGLRLRAVGEHPRAADTVGSRSTASATSP